MRTVYQNFLFTAFCIFLDSAIAQHKRFKINEIHTKNDDSHTELLSRHVYNIPNRPFDEIVGDKRVKSKQKCKGKVCQNGNDDMDEDFHFGKEKNDWENTHKMKNDEYGKEGRFDKKRIKSAKERDSLKSAKNVLKMDDSQQHYGNEGEIGSSSKRRIIENVIVVKDKLGHLKNIIENIKKKRFGSEERNDLLRKNNKIIRSELKKGQIYPKLSMKGADMNDSSEKEKPFAKVKSKLKTKYVESQENTQEGNRKSNSRNRRKLRNFDSIEENGIVQKTPESNEVEDTIVNVEAISYGDETCETIGRSSRENKNDYCNSDEDSDEEESDFHTKKFKFSIKYAHEKKKLSPNRDDHFVKKIHGLDKKKRRLDDDDSDEEDEFPKRLYHVIDDDE